MTSEVEAVLSAMVTAVANRAEAADVLEDLVEQIERESAVAAALEQLVATVEATAHDPWEAEAAAVRVNADVIVTMHAMVRQVEASVEAEARAAEAEQATSDLQLAMQKDIASVLIALVSSVEEAQRLSTSPLLKIDRKKPVQDNAEPQSVSSPALAMLARKRPEACLC